MKANGHNYDVSDTRKGNFHEKQITYAGYRTALFTATLAVPFAAHADDSRQKNKNTWRNGAIGAGAVGLYGLIKGNKTATLLGAAGAAYSANRYEQDRKSQDQAKRSRARYHRSGGDYTRDGRKYYKYDGHMYYKDLNDGSRHKIS